MENILYKACKRIILRHKIPEDMRTRLDVLFAGGSLSQEHYTALIQLLENEGGVES